MRDGKYDLALKFDRDLTLEGLARILKYLEDGDVYVSYSTLEFYEDGMFAEACTDCECIEDFIKTIDGVELDWDTMSEWYNGEDEE